MQTFGEYFKSNKKWIKKKNITDGIGKSNHTNHTDKSNHTDVAEIEKSKAHIIVEIIEYVPDSVVNKTIIKKITGNVTVSSFDEGEELAEKTSPFDNYIQIIDGAAEVIINEKTFKLKLGEG
jgi:hypothetical protein